MVILLAMMLFSFYLQLMIARSKDNLQLLLTLGYSPRWLSRTVAKKWIPVYVIIVLTALIITAVFQWYFKQAAMKGREELSMFIHWIVILIALLLLALSIMINYKMVSKLLRKL
jgi:multisubunit Na+/H+ antiporter MnhB subunit